MEATGAADASGRSARHRGAPTGLILAVVCVAALVVNLDNTILNVALPTLVDDLKATTDQLQWVVDAYAMVLGGLMLTAGSLADRVGRKRLLIIGLAIFGGGSLGAALCGHIVLLIVWRAVMGVGAALIIPAGLATITSAFDDPIQRTKAIGVWSGVIGLGIAIGPVIGGLLLAHFWWGSVFLVNVPIAVVGILGAIRLVPESRGGTRRAADVLGSLLSIAGLGMVLWAIIEGPTKGWTSAEVVGVGAAGVLVCVAFVLWERHSEHPMLPLAYFRLARFSAPVATLAIGVFALFGGLFIVTQFLQFSLGYSALGAGLRMLPTSGGIVAGAVVAGPVVARWGNKLVAAAGMASVSLGLALIALVSTDGSGYQQQLPGLILIGLGTGLFLPACTGAVLGAVAGDNAGVGSAVNSTAQQVGGAVGVAVIGSVLSTRYQDVITGALAGHPLPEAATTAILGSVGGALRVAEQAGGTQGVALAAAARDAFLSGYRSAAVVGAAVTAAAVVLVLVALPSRPPAGAAE